MKHTGYDIKLPNRQPRTAWQWHELYEYIKNKQINEFIKLNLDFDNCNIEYIPYSKKNKYIRVKYDSLLQKCKQEMMK